MRTKLFLLIALLCSSFTLMAQRTGLSGVVVDAESGKPVAGASVILEDQNILVVTGQDGDFLITSAKAGDDKLLIMSYGYKDSSTDVHIVNNVVDDMGTIKVSADALGVDSDSDNAVTESLLEDEEGNSQSIGALTGASDNVYYQSASYDFNAMRFRYRGYDQQYSETYINGVDFNEPIRGRFNYGALGGMNQAFRNKSIALATAASNAGIGGLGGTTNISTYAKDYSPGFRAGVAYTNSNYYLRGHVTYATGLNKHGWALTLSGIVRYSHKGWQDGTFYNSGGLFLSLQKVFNDQHSLSLTAFGAPTERAGASATYQEAYDLTGDNLYNPNWGYQDGKQRSAKVVKTFDPTAILNWIWTPKSGTTLNTGFAFRLSKYASSALNWHNAADPRPDYYRHLPSYFDEGTLAREYYTQQWQTNVDFRQLDWQKLYNANWNHNADYDYFAAKNPEQAQTVFGKSKGSAVYLLENRHNDQKNFMFNSTLNHRLNEFMTLQAGIGANYTIASYYKTVKDLLGAYWWHDIDTYSERDFPDQPEMLQNNLRNPDRFVGKGERFGYDYNINQITANAFIQNQVNTAHWDVNYGVKFTYISYQRDGKMENGRSFRLDEEGNKILNPDGTVKYFSYGKGERHNFANVAARVGLTYKLDGHNNFIINGAYETRAPYADQAYISPKIKDDAINKDYLKNEQIISGDISYVWNYRRFKGVISAFITQSTNGIERFSFYDDQYSTFMNYVLGGVKKVYKGVEIGMAFKITPSLTLSAAGTFARYQYKNRPIGTRSYENGMTPDITKQVYLKNFYLGGTPQQAYNASLNWAAPKQWFFEVSGSWMGDAYVTLSPVRHEQMPALSDKVGSEQEYYALMGQITKQEKLKNAFVLNLSIGKLIYLTRKTSMNLNLNIDNILNNRQIMTSGYQQGRFDYTNYDVSKYPNKYMYGQGIKVSFNVGIKF